MPETKSNPGLDRVRFELRATGVKPESSNHLRSGVHSRGYLPHVKRENASYFVTFRLDDSLPKDVLFKFQAERNQRLRMLLTNKTDTEELIERDHLRQIERYLDRGTGSCCLRQPEIAEAVSNVLRHFDGQRYQLSDWVVMPNHVHVVLWPMPNYLLGEILKSWKGYSAREVNKRLKRSGKSLWQSESFDHWIRNDEEKARICRYITHNPVTAGLCAKPQEWQWSSSWPGWRRSSDSLPSS